MNGISLKNEASRIFNKRKRPVQYDLFFGGYPEEQVFDIDTITGLKKEFLNVFAEIKQSNMEKFISMFVDGREHLWGAGGSSGKSFEQMFSQAVESYTNFFACKLEIVNNGKTTTDVLVSKSPKVRDTNFIKANFIKNGLIHYNRLCNFLDNNPFLDISLKQYKNKSCQITTRYDLREFCEKFIKKDTTCNNQEIIQIVVDELDSMVSGNKIIMSGQFFSKNNTYKFNIYEGFSRINSIRNTMKQKHDCYELMSNEKVVAHLKYGKGQSDVYQRGLWVNDFNFFTCIYKGSYIDIETFSGGQKQFISDCLSGKVELY